MSIESNKLMNLADGKVLYDDLRGRVDQKLTTPSTPGTSGQVLTSDGNGGQSWQDAQGSGGADGVTFTPSVSQEGVISWTNDGGRTNPQSVNIKGPKGDTGDPAPSSAVVPAVEDWLDENVTQETGYVLDRTLLLSNAAAPADMVGTIKNEINGKVDDVKINGTSIVSNGIANIPLAQVGSSTTPGVVRTLTSRGLSVNDGTIEISRATAPNIKDGTHEYRPIVPSVQEYSVFYGLSKAAGADLASSETSLGVYPENAKKAILNMLGLPSGIMFRNHDAIDGIYAACAKSQRNYLRVLPQFCLLIAGDIHADSTRMDSMIELFNNVSAFDAGILLGDIVSSTWTDSATFYTDAIENVNKPWLTVIGNHDAGFNSGSQPTTANGYRYIADLHDKYIAPNIEYADLASGEYTTGDTYYYKDFADYGIRLIVLNQYDYPADVEQDGVTLTYFRGKNCYSETQLTWLCDTLLDTPSAYSVIIAMHSFPAEMEVENSPLSASTWRNSPVEDIMTHDIDGYVIPQIVNAFIEGTSLEKTFGYQPNGTWTSADVDVDFSNRGAGKFICYIGGHWHMSELTHVKAFPNQKMYTVDASQIRRYQSDTPRIEGTRSEDSFCAMGVDTENSTVKIFAIGAHFTKDGTDRLYNSFSYDSNNVPCTGISLSDSTLSITTLGGTQTLTATITPANTTFPVIWTSSDPNIATVTSEGVVKTTGIGTVDIIASCGSQSASCTVTSTWVANADTVTSWTGYDTFGLNFNSDRDYVSNSTGDRFRTYAMTVNTFDGPRLISNPELDFSYLYPIPIPYGTTSIKVRADAMYNNTSWRYVLVNGNERTTYSSLTGEAANCCRRYGGNTSQALTEGIDNDRWFVIDLTQESASINAFAFTIADKNSSDPTAGKTGFVEVTFT